MSQARTERRAPQGPKHRPGAAVAAALLVAALGTGGGARAAEPLFSPGPPEEIGVVVGSYRPPESLLASVTAWKSVRVRATASGTATHFLIRILSTTGIETAPVGFAVYAGTAGYTDPIGPLIARGYHAAYRFDSGPGWYALPFTLPETFAVTAGDYYHLAFLLNPEATALNFARANNDDPYPPKWNSACIGAACDHREPPGVGGETWSFQYASGSAPWVMGLLAAAGPTDSTPPAAPTGLAVPEPPPEPALPAAGEN